MNFKGFLIALSVCLAALIFVSCNKGEGEGGSGTIKGRIKISSYSLYFSERRGSYYAGDKRVFLIYGQQSTAYDQDVETNYDGTFEFRYLRPGKYRLFTYSDDSTQTQPSGLLTVFRDVEIQKSGQVVDLGEIIVAKEEEF